MGKFESVTTAEELTEALRSIQDEKDVSELKEFTYVIYVRKSTDDKDKQVRSLEDQIADCKQFAEENNLKWKEIIRESESAKEPDIRPKFRMMLNNIKEGKYNSILAWHPDRLARNMKDAGEMIDLLDKGVIRDMKFKSFTFQNDASGKMLLGITFVLSKQYSDHLSDSVSRGNRLSLEEGKYINKTKHGYYKDKDQRMWPDGDNFIFIKNAFKMRVEGKTMEEIAKYLNGTGYTRIRNGVTRVFEWNKGKLEKMLKDPAFCGVAMYGKKVLNLIEMQNFQPAISVIDFMKINHLNDKSEVFKLARIHRREEDIKANLMRGMIICDECGEVMHSGITPKKLKGGVTKYFYYRCDTDDCSRYGKSVRAKYVMDYIYDFLNKKPFSSQASYKHYTVEMNRVAEERLIEAKRLLQSFKAKKVQFEDKLIRTKDILISDEEKELISRGKGGILTYQEFLELFEKMGQIMAKIKNMSELDYLCRKMFLNFTVSGKKVVNAMLNQPFKDLYEAKVLSGGRGET